MSKNILMMMFLTFVAVAPAGAADMNVGSSQTKTAAASDSSNESVDCFYEQNRFFPECNK